jgi:integrase
VTAQPHAHVRFRRAIERRALWLAEDAARELPNLPLEDALQLVHLYFERGSPKALDSLVARLDSPYVFAGPKRGPFDVHNFRRREWSPAVDAAGIAKPARLYDLRSTFASNALAAGITVYELARIMGTSVSMIEAHYGALLDTAHDSLLERLEAVQ